MDKIRYPLYSGSIEGKAYKKKKKQDLLPCYNNYMVE